MISAYLADTRQILSTAQNLSSEDWFDAEQYLGRRGHKYFSRGTKLWLSAIADLAAPENILPEECGIALGAMHGGSATLDILQEQIRSGGVGELSPSFAPNFCQNLIVGQASKKLGMRRFGVLLTTPYTAGLDALEIAARELSSGRCRFVLSGAVEERPAQSRLSHREGGVALALTSSDEIDRSKQSRSLSGFASATLPPLNRWVHEGGLVGRILKRTLSRNSFGLGRYNRLVIVGQKPDSIEGLSNYIAEAGGSWDEIVRVTIEEKHGTLEPVVALVDAIEHDQDGVDLFIYYHDSGPFRAIAVHRCNGLFSD